MKCKRFKFIFIRISKLPFHVLWKILVPYSRFPIHVFLKILIPYSIPTFHFMLFDRYWSELIKQIFRIVRSQSFPKIKCRCSICWEFKKWKWFGICSWIIWSNLVGPKLKIIGLGSHGHVPKSGNHEHEGVFWFSQSEIEKLLVQNEAK